MAKTSQNQAAHQIGALLDGFELSVAMSTLAQVQASIFAHHAAHDEAASASIDAYCEALKELVGLLRQGGEA